MNVTVVIVNCKTPKLIRRSLSSVLRFYPTISIILVDNGSHDDSRRYIKKRAKSSKTIRAILNQDNIGHGAGMHQGIQLARTPYVLTFDTDCKMIHSGLVERMLRKFQNQLVYAVGSKQYVNNQGIDVTKKEGWQYIHPAVMMLDVAKYGELPPFIHHGAPCIINMQYAKLAGYKFARFKITKFVKVGWSGTRKLFGGRIPGWGALEPSRCLTAPQMIEKTKSRIIG